MIARLSSGRWIILICLVNGSLCADDWAHWRGTHRNDVVSEPSEWKDGVWSPREIWRAMVPEGASSPLIHGDWVIVEVGAKQGNLIALDKNSGRQVWASQSTAPAAHNAGPVPIAVEGVPCVAVHNFDGLLVVRLDRGHEGETVATWPWVTSFANNIATVTVHEDSVLLTSAYNQNKIARLQVTLQGAKVLWQQEAASKVCTPVIHDGHVYWAWQNLICLDYETGDLQ